MYYNPTASPPQIFETPTNYVLLSFLVFLPLRVRNTSHFRTRLRLSRKLRICYVLWTPQLLEFPRIPANYVFLNTSQEIIMIGNDINRHRISL
jgi:hypothetical protein